MRGKDPVAATTFPPPELLERLESVLPPDRLQAYLELSATVRAVAIRVNTLKADVQDLCARLDVSGIEITPIPWCPDAFLTNSTPRILQETEAWRNGLFHIQSLSSTAVAPMLDPKPGERILDMCAAPGSKTSHIAALMRGEGELVANDLSKARMHRMRAILEKLGVEVTIRVGSGDQIGRREPESFDRVLVDAPCSGEGRMRADEPKSYANWKRSVPRRLGSRQKSLLHSAIDAVKPGGVVVYSTCTFAPEENELVLARALQRYEGRIELESLPIDIPGSLSPIETWNGKPLPDLAAARRLAPPDMEGFFIARLRRTG